jgi:hypothetical protein
MIRAWLLLISLYHNTVQVPGIATEEDCWALGRTIVQSEKTERETRRSAVPQCLPYNAASGPTPQKAPEIRR